MSRPGWVLVAALLCGGAQAVSLAWPWAGAWAGQPWPLLQWLSLLGLVGLLRSAPTAAAAGVRGWLFAQAWLAGTFWWLFISMHTYGGLAAPLAALAVWVLAAALGLYYGVAAWLFWRWHDAAPWRQALAFAALWTLAEWARGTWFTGFPWGAGGYAQVDALAWLAPWVGVYGMGAVSAGLAAWVAAWACGQGGRRWLRVLALVPWWACLLVPSLGAAWLAWQPAWTRPHGSLAVTLLQGNIPQDEKFQGGSGIPLAMQWYAEQIRAAIAQSAAPALVVAPETAIPVLPQELDPAYWQGLMRDVAVRGSAVMLGVPLGSSAVGYTNSVVAWTPAPLAAYRYDKHHLVPFGEFIPPLFRWFVALMNIPQGEFGRGGLAQPALPWAGQRIAPNICYEDLFGEELAASFTVPGQAPTVLVNVSNIAWFGNSVAIDQHRHISRLRALELQRPMLRATNTGATVAIDHLGRVQAELPRLTRASLQATVEGREGTTPYAWWAGRWGLWPLVGACVVALWLCRPRRMAHLP
ncbi:MAG TPA: apolipoprotein N-acyltransferase [Macromonas sp.]|nr:apolipoprotein N-acyltransferase [Macromonas sp.]